MSQELHVINDPDLISHVQRERSNKDLEARAITQRTGLVQRFFGDLIGQSKETIEIMTQNLDEKSYEVCHRSDTHRLMSGGLGPTAHSTIQLYRDTLAVIAQEIETMTMGSPECLDLSDWVRKVITLGTAVAFHGPGNPISKSPELIPMLCADVLKKRETLIDEYRKFFAEEANKRDSDKKYSEIIRDIKDLDTQYGFDEDATTRSAFALVSGVTSNSAPATFWIITLVLCNPPLHARIMRELKDAIVLERDEHGAGTPRLIFDIKMIKQKCPLLCATFYEVLRLKTTATVSLRVEKDFLLDGRYMLKKNALIMMPNAALHIDPASWGADAREFRPERFLDSKQHLSASFRPFGAGYNICPGRHLAKDEIIGTAAIVLFSFDMSPGGPSRGDGFRPPKAFGTHVATTVTPSEAFKVKFTPRKELRGAKWSVV
ncbi:putative cytochrome P450 [Escovopsis weberi]|uniref:Putative cytochrome P450 n=1 Tax=Escovopsis weberi TaxID=150374 RepID=A0A0M9VRW1_ESCWE|nr:putative cytochrome P450 [Escovopsis weberi]